MIEQLLGKGARVRAFDPVAMEEARRIFVDQPELQLVKGPEEALQGADALVIVTEWNVFRSPDFDLIKATLTHPAIFDGRNLYDPVSLKAMGFEYFGIGRGDSVRVPLNG